MKFLLFKQNTIYNLYIKKNNNFLKIKASQYFFFTIKTNKSNRKILSLKTNLHENSLSFKIFSLNLSFSFTKFLKSHYSN